MPLEELASKCFGENGAAVLRGYVPFGNTRLRHKWTKPPEFCPAAMTNSPENTDPLQRKTGQNQANKVPLNQ